MWYPYCVWAIIDYPRRSPGKSWDLLIFFGSKCPGKLEKESWNVLDFQLILSVATLLLDPCSTEGPIKSPLSGPICLSILHFNIFLRSDSLRVLIFCLQINTSLLQVDSISLGVCSQACPNYPKQQFYNIFAISQGKCQRWSWFLPPDECQRLLQIDTIILIVCGQACPNYLK